MSATTQDTTRHTVNVRDELRAGAGPDSGQVGTGRGLTAPACQAAAAGYRAFPTEALPGALRRFVEQAARALGCDPATVALPALAAYSSLAGATRAVQLKGCWSEPCVLWTGVVGEAGTRKSAGLQQATRFLFRQQTLPGMPVLYRQLVSMEVRAAKLAAVLDHSPRGILVLRDDLAGWLGSSLRQRGAGAEAEAWLQMHGAGSLLMQRTRNKQPLYVPRAAASVTGGIQPSVLARLLTPEFRDSGLGGRLLLAMPPPPVKRWSDDDIDAGVVQASPCGRSCA